MWLKIRYVVALCVLLSALPSHAVLDKIIFGTLTDDTVPVQEAWTGQKMYVVHRFGGFCDQSWYDWMFGEMLGNWNNGRVTHFTLSPNNRYCAAVEIDPQDPNQYITEGKWDAQLGWFIAGLKTFINGPDKVLGTADDRRLYIRLGHELNGNWYSWSKNSTSYQEMWRYVVNRVRAVGFTSSHLQWIFEPVSPFESDEAHDFRLYWPGDAYVDWVSLDAYNNQMLQQWYEPWEMFDPMLYKLRDWRPHLPVMISETGADSTGGDTARKNIWITTLCTYLAQANVQMLVYFNTNDNPHDWPYFWSTQNVGFSSIVGSDGKTYNVYPNWKSSVQALAYKLTNPTSPRIMTDDEFQGRLPGYQTPPAKPRNLLVYNNGAEFNEWQCTPAPYAVNLKDTSVKRTGESYSMSINLAPWGNVQIHSAQMGFNTSYYNSFQFNIYTAQANVKLSIKAFTRSREFGSIGFTGPVANTWTQFTFTWAQLGVPVGTFLNGFYISGASSSNQGNAYFAGVQLLSNPFTWPAGWGSSTPAPTARPTVGPTATPTTAPTTRPTSAPTARPTQGPTTRPPTSTPTAVPTAGPTPGFETRFSTLSTAENLSGAATVANGLTLKCTSAVNGECARWQTTSGFGYGSFTFRVRSGGASGTSLVMMGETTTGTYTAWQIGLPGSSRDVSFQAYGGWSYAWRSWALGFDPTVAFHEYKIMYTSSSLSLYVDGMFIMTTPSTISGLTKLVIYEMFQTQWYGPFSGSLPVTSYASYAAWTPL